MISVIRRFCVEQCSVVEDQRHRERHDKQWDHETDQNHGFPTNDLQRPPAPGRKPCL